MTRPPPLATRAAAQVSLTDPGHVALLLRELRQAGVDDAAARLLDRDPAAHTSLDDPGGVSSLLDELRAGGAAGQVTTLLDRNPAAQVSLTDGFAVPVLLDALREAGARGQVVRLIERLPAAGLFRLFCGQEGRAERFRFGRQADGRPAKLWAWTDLG